MKICQVDYSEYDIGRNNPENKREVNFNFTIDEEEFSIQLKWSFTSGKQTIWVNSREVYYGQKNGQSVIDQKFPFQRHKFHLIGTRTVPRGQSMQTYRCFELLINGTLFSQTPRPGQTEARPDRYGSILDILYPTLRYGCQDQAPPPQTSARRKHPGAQAPQAAPVADLLSFDAPAPPAAAPYETQLVAPAPVAHTADLFGALSVSPPPFGAPTQAADPFGAPQVAAAPMQAADPFGAPQATPPQAADPFGAPQVEAAPADPFGAPAAANPFGAPVSPTPQAAPFGAPPAAANPFEVAPALPPPPMEAPPPPPTEDPPPPPAAEPWSPPAADPFGSAPAEPWANVPATPPASDALFGF